MSVSHIVLVSRERSDLAVEKRLESEVADDEAIQLVGSSLAGVGSRGRAGPAEALLPSFNSYSIRYR